MILGAEIAMIVIGIYALITGKLPSNKKAKHEVRGWPARVIGFLALLPLPAALAIGMGVGVLFAIQGKPVTEESFKWVGIAIEVGVVLFFVVLISVLASVLKTPVEPPRRRAAGGNRPRTETASKPEDSQNEGQFTPAGPLKPAGRRKDLDIY